MDISFVIPCYCSGNNIREVVQDIDDIMNSMALTYEIIMVNDGSPDNTFEILEDIVKLHQNTMAIDLARNSGQHAAIMAGFNHARGDLIIPCEDDGQTDIRIIPKLIEKIKQGYDVAAPRYTDRGERSLFRRFGTKCATLMAKWMIPRPKDIVVPIFFVAKRFVIQETIKYNQPYPYIEGLILRSTFNVALVDAEQKERLDGKSGYTLRKMLSLWLNGFTSFSIKPLRLSVFLGVFIAIIGMIAGIVIVVNKIINPNVLMGWSSIFSLLLFMFGILFIILGLIGEYIGRIYLCINKTPQFVIRQVVSSDKKRGEYNE
jgi:undecaprenyl-phosphate 4-deoxy-4-formamido-L-arabinose transferase